MIEYIIILLLLFWGTFKELTIKYYKNDKLFRVLFILMWLYSGLRYRVGTDTFWYMELFNYFPSIDQFDIKTIFDYKIEPLWIIYNSVLKLFCNDFVIVQLISSLIFNLAVFKFVKQRTTYVFLSLSLYFALDYLLMNFEFMRQTTALGLYYLFVHDYFDKRKYLFWTVGLILCMLMHSTVVFCAFLPFVNRLHLSIKQIIFILIVCLCIVLSNQVFNILSYFVPKNLSAAEKIISYRDNLQTVYTLNFFISKFYMFFLVSFCLLYNKHSKYSGIMVLYSIVLALTAANDIFDRLHYCLCVFYYLVFADVIKMILNRRPKILFISLICILALPNIVYFMHDYGNNHYVYNKFFPYYSYINPQKSPVREDMQNGTSQFYYIFK